MVKRSIRERGVAFVEAAIILPLFVLIFALFWDVAVTLICRIRHQSALVQVAVDFRRTPLHALIDTTGAFPQLVVSQASGDLLTGPSGVLQEFNKMVGDSLQQAGTGASYVQNSVMSELWFVHVCTDASVACPGGGGPGSAYDAEVAGTASGAPATEFTQPIDARCFDGVPNFRDRFTEWKKTHIETILKTGSDPGAIPFGTMLFDVNTGPLAIGRVLQYLEWRPLMFVAVCSDPPQMMASEPTVSYFVHFFDKQVSRPL